MKKEFMEETGNILSKTGSDYSEIYYEKYINKTYHYISEKLYNIISNVKRGVRLRILKDNTTYFSSMSDTSEKNMIKEAKKLSKNLNGSSNSKIKLIKKINNSPKVNISHDKLINKEKIKYFDRINKIARNYSELIKKMENVIVVYKKNSQLPSVNADNLSIQVCGNLVKNGKQIGGLKTFIINLSYYDLLNKVNYIGNDLLFTNISLGTPSIVVKDIDAII